MALLSDPYIRAKIKILLRVKLVYMWVADHFIFQGDTEKKRNFYRNSLFGELTT